MPSESVQTLAEQFRQARLNNTPIAPITAAQPDLSVEDAYAIQFANTAHRLQDGARAVGWKVGLTVPEAQQRMGATAPVFGRLFADMVLTQGTPVPFASLNQPRVEGEIALVMRTALRGPGVTIADALAAIGGAMAAIELVDTRLTAFPTRVQDMLADNCLGHAIIVNGVVHPVDGIDLRLVGMLMAHNGRVIGTGAGAAAMGHPAFSLAWLANALAPFGVGLEAGEIVMTGSLTVAPVVQAGDVFTVSFDRLGTVSVGFGAS